MKIDRFDRLATTGALCAAALLAACTTEKKSGGDAAADGQPAQGAEMGGAGAAGGVAFSTTQLTPESGRKVVVVQMMTDEAGNNRFDPAEFEVHKGDVVRWTLKSGVHNVHFVADSNKSAQGLPAQPADMAQLPGQTLDLKVTSAPGRYYFQCDPHALLGMVGHMKVED